jgi:hypothetical protein
MENYVESSRIDRRLGIPPTYIIMFKRGFEIAFRRHNGKLVLVSRTGIASDAEYSEAVQVASNLLVQLAPCEVRPAWLHLGQAAAHARKISAHTNDD